MMMNINHSVADPRSRGRETGATAAAITDEVSRLPLEQEKAKAPDFMILEYQLPALMIRQVPQRWFRKQAFGNTRCFFEVSKAMLPSAWPRRRGRIYFAGRSAFSGRLI
jgi:hypothetical protein